MNRAAIIALRSHRRTTAITGTAPAMSTWGESLAQGSAAGGPGPLWFPNQIATDVGAVWGRTISMYNGGYGGQRTEGVSARQGGRPGVLNAFTVPAGTTAVTFTFSNGVDVLGNAVQQTPIPVKVGTVNPIAGLLTKLNNGNPSADNWPFQFTRAVAGTARAIIAGETMTFDVGTEHRADGHIIWTGHNNKTVQPGTGGTVNMVTAVQGFIQNMVDFIQPPTGDTLKRYVVCGLITTNPANAPPGTTQAQIDALFADVATVNAQLSTRFGSHYLSMLDYIASKQALVDAGVITAAENPSALDQQGIDGGWPPQSLAAPLGNPHLNAAGNRVLGQRVANRIIAEDWRI